MQVAWRFFFLVELENRGFRCVYGEWVRDYLREEEVESNMETRLRNNVVLEVFGFYLLIKEEGE